MLELILNLAVGMALALVFGMEALAARDRQKRLERRVGHLDEVLGRQAGEPRPTTTPVSKEGRWAVDSATWDKLRELGVTSRGSPASRSLNQTLDSLQALGQQASLGISHVVACSECQARLEQGHLSYRTLAQAVVDLASTSPRQATPVSAELEQGPATSGLSDSSERIRDYPVREGTGTVAENGEQGGPYRRAMNEY